MADGENGMDLNEQNNLDEAALLGEGADGDAANVTEDNSVEDPVRLYMPENRIGFILQGCMVYRCPNSTINWWTMHGRSLKRKICSNVIISARINS